MQYFSKQQNEYKIVIYVTDRKETTEVESLILVTDPPETVSPFINVTTLFTPSEVSCIISPDLDEIMSDRRDKSANFSITSN